MASYKHQRFTLHDLEELRTQIKIATDDLDQFEREMNEHNPGYVLANSVFLFKKHIPYLQEFCKELLGLARPASLEIQLYGMTEAEHNQQRYQRRKKESLQQ
jgi:hypothetical protein